MRCYVVYDIYVLLSWLRFANHGSHQHSKFPAVSFENDTEIHELDDMLEFALYDYFVKVRIMVKLLIESFEKKRETVSFKMNAGHFWLMSETRCVCGWFCVVQGQSLKKLKQKGWLNNLKNSLCLILNNN